MAVTATTNDLINGALRLIGVLAEGETPSADTSNDSLTAMRQMVDSWNTESLSIFNTQEQVFSWPSATRMQSLGPSGDFIGNRPVALQDSTYFIDPGTGVSYAIVLITQGQYDGIALKTVSSTFPQVMWVNTAFDNVQMYIYPVPTRVLEWHFVSYEDLTNPVTLADTLAFPPGYLRAFRYNLAMELAPEFGVEPSAQVQRIAMTAKRNIKRINAPEDTMAMPYSLMDTRGRFNVYTGQP